MYATSLNAREDVVIGQSFYLKGVEQLHYYYMGQTNQGEIFSLVGIGAMMYDVVWSKLGFCPYLAINDERNMPDLYSRPIEGQIVEIKDLLNYNGSFTSADLHTEFRVEEEGHNWVRIAGKKISKTRVAKRGAFNRNRVLSGYQKEYSSLKEGDVFTTNHDIVKGQNNLYILVEPGIAVPLKDSENGLIIPDEYQDFNNLRQNISVHDHPMMRVVIPSPRRNVELLTKRSSSEVATLKGNFAPKRINFEQVTRVFDQNLRGTYLTNSIYSTVYSDHDRLNFLHLGPEIFSDFSHDYNVSDAAKESCVNLGAIEEYCSLDFGIDRFQGLVKDRLNMLPEEIQSINSIIRIKPNNFTAGPNTSLQSVIGLHQYIGSSSNSIDFINDRLSCAREIEYANIPGIAKRLCESSLYMKPNFQHNAEFQIGFREGLNEEESERLTACNLAPSAARYEPPRNMEIQGMNQVSNMEERAITDLFRDNFVGNTILKVEKTLGRNLNTIQEFLNYIRGVAKKALSSKREIHQGDHVKCKKPDQKGLVKNEIYKVEKIDSESIKNKTHIWIETDQGSVFSNIKNFKRVNQ